MSLKNIHNDSYVAVYEHGNVSIKGIDGSTSVFVKKGDVDIHISQIKHESRIHVEEGDINLKLIDTHPLKLTIDANQVRRYFEQSHYFCRVLCIRPRLAVC